MKAHGNNRSLALTIGMLVLGGVLFVSTGRGLISNKELRTPPNPFGINGSPYGEVFAMAMQTPIDNYWNQGLEQHEASHSHSIQAEPKAPDTPSKPGNLRTRLRIFIEHLSEAKEERTNPKPPSQAQTFNTRREIENKLRFAYELDPAHYANYNSYYFFLTQPQLGTHPELTPEAAKLSERTIRYCLSRTDDPRPALTAAAAAENLLELMFDDRAQGHQHYTTATMREYLGLLDLCISRYHEIATRWNATGNWDLLSPQRRLECADRLSFIMKVREAAEKTIQRHETAERDTTAPGTPPSPNR